MAIDLVESVPSTMSDQTALQEVATVGIKSMEHLVNLASEKTQAPQIDPKQLSIFIAPLKRAISTGSIRTGHALFRRAPVQPPPIQIPPSTPSLPPKTLTLDFKKAENVDPNASSRRSAFFSTITGDKTVSNKPMITPNPSLIVEGKKPQGSAAKPPLHGKRCREQDQTGKSMEEENGCHCKKRDNTIKRTIRVKVVGQKIADIPPDEYSWRKYGQKPIKGSQFPRGYYRCSCVKGCPARKHVERATDDSTILVVTYKDEHNHKAKQENVAEGTLMVFVPPAPTTSEN